MSQTVRTNCKGGLGQLEVVRNRGENGENGESRYQQPNMWIEAKEEKREVIQHDGTRHLISQR